MYFNLLGVMRIRSSTGMSSLPKQLATNVPSEKEDSLPLNVQKECKVVKLERKNDTQVRPCFLVYVLIWQLVD